MPEGVVELGGRVKVLSGQDMTSCIFPEPLDYVEVRRIRGQENEADTEFGGLVLYSLAMLIPRIVENDGDRGTARFPSHFFKKGHRLVGIHIDHGMGVYEVKGKGIHASEKIEAVPSRSGLEVKGLLAPHMAGEGFQREMDGIHKIELALALFRLIYNWLQCGDPFLLFLRTRSARNGLCLYEPQAAAVHYLPCPCQAERDAADVPDDVRGLGGTSRNFGFQSPGNLIHVPFQSAWTSRNRDNFENGIDTFVVIAMNQAVNEVAAASCDCSYPCATQSGFRHFGHKGTATFADYAAGSRFVFLFETGIRLLTIFDGEQCCIDNVMDKVVIYQRRSPSFIGYGGLSHFAQILYVLPIKIAAHDSS